MLTEADYTAIGIRGLMDSGYTNLAVRNPWGLAGTNENINSNFGGRIADWGRAHVEARLSGAPAAPWEEFLQGRLFLAGVQGVNPQVAADQFAKQHGVSDLQFAPGLAAAFEAAAVTSSPTASVSSSAAAPSGRLLLLGAAALALIVLWRS